MLNLLKNNNYQLRDISDKIVKYDSHGYKHVRKRNMWSELFD